MHYVKGRKQIMAEKEIYIEKEKLIPNPLNHFPVGDLDDLKNTIE